MVEINEKSRLQEEVSSGRVTHVSLCITKVVQVREATGGRDHYRCAHVDGK